MRKPPIIELYKQTMRFIMKLGRSPRGYGRFSHKNIIIIEYRFVNRRFGRSEDRYNDINDNC